MGRAAPVARVSGLVALLVASTNCGGELIRLGDGPTRTDATSEGSAGQVDDGGRTMDGSVEASGPDADGASCPHGQVQANEVLWIGDSWVTIPGTQHTRLRDLARAARAIGPNEDYVDRAASATTIAAITSQYTTQEASPTKVKVLIMDGGTWDTITANGSDSSVAGSLAGFQQLLARIAGDGTVENIVYFLVPELPTIPGVSALRPGLEQACMSSAVPCYFLDLQPLWADHPEYTDNSGIQASEAGATVIATEIWKIMQKNCIAQ